MLEGLLERTRNPLRRAEHEAALECPPFPLELTYLWNAFNRLSARRSSNGFAVSPISWTDIDAFLRRSGLSLAPFEIRIVEDLDDLYRAEQSRVKDQA